MAQNYFSPYSLKLVLLDAIRQNNQTEQHQSKRMSNVYHLACQYQYKFCVYYCVLNISQTKRNHFEIMSDYDKVRVGKLVLKGESSK